MNIAQLKPTVSIVIFESVKNVIEIYSTWYIVKKNNYYFALVTPLADK